MGIQEQIQHILTTSPTFLISTVDTRGFPTTIVVSPPLYDKGMHEMTFYLNAAGETADNILRNPQGAVCCFIENEHQSLVLKGHFQLRGLKEEDKKYLNEYQISLKHQEAVLAIFETMICKLHAEGVTRSFIF